MQMSKKKKMKEKVSIRLFPEQKKMIEKEVEESPDYFSFSHFIRCAVNYYFANQEEDTY